MKKDIALILFLVISLIIFTRVVLSTPETTSSFAKTIVPSGLGPLNKANIIASQLPGSDIERLNVQKDLQDEITADGLENAVSIYYKNLTGNYEVSINGDASWNPASTVKAYVLLEAFRQKQEKIVNFDSRVVIDDGNVVPTELESSDYQPLRAGSRATIRELVYAMITQSDNTAYNTLLDVLDRRNVSSTLRHFGFADTIVGEKLSLSDQQYAKDLLVLGRQSNKTTVRDFGRFFALLYEKKVPDSDEILTILKKQKINDMLPALLPQNIDIAHKTGTWSPYYHDGGIVYKPNDPFIVVIFTNHNAPSVVARLSKIAYYKSRDVLGVSVINVLNMLLDIFYKTEHLLWPQK